MFYNYAAIGFDGLMIFGAFVFIGIYGYTTLMDRKGYAVWIEVLRGLAGITLIWVTGDWFGIDIYFKSGSLVIASYFLLTILAGVYFTYLEKDPINTKVAY